MDGNLHIPFNDLGSQYNVIESEVMAAISATLRRADFVMGKNVELFEEEFASYCGTHYAIGVDSGMSALELSLRAYDIGYGDEVITAASGFVGTALAILHTGATPVLVDIDPDTYVLNPAGLEAAITPQTKAIVPVHLYGHPVDMNAVTDVARKHRLCVIEEASQAHGARYRGQRVGLFGHATSFGLYPTTNLGAYGDAGIVVTDDRQIAEKIRLLRNCGYLGKGVHSVPGYCRRMDTVHASVLRIKLRYLDEWNTTQRRNAKLYGQLLAATNVVTPTESADAEPVYHRYVIQANERDLLRKQLRRSGIDTEVHYPLPIHLQRACASLGYKKGAFPVAEQLAKSVLSLPMYPSLRLAQIEYIADVMSHVILELTSAPADLAADKQPGPQFSVLEF